MRKSTKAPASMRTWHIAKIARNTYYCEDGYRSDTITGAHCPACVYTQLVGEYGGNVDLRGLSRYGICFGFLSVMVRQERDRVAEGGSDVEKGS